MSEQSLWIGRFVAQGEQSRAGAPVARWVRVRTQGGCPQPDDLAEEIPDPLGRTGACDELWHRVEALEALDQGERGPLGELLGDKVLVAPVFPTKVIGIGRNYGAHAAELGNEVPKEPLVFFKPPSCLVGSGSAIELPADYGRTDMEAELVVVIGRRARRVRKEQAWDFVGGYTLGNDVSCRELQKIEKQWVRAKGSDSFGPVGPFVRLTRPGFVLPVESLRVRGYVDDELTQDASPQDMIFDIPTLIAHLSTAMTLEVGDLIYTGTPAGVTTLSPGRRCRVELQGWDLGQLTNPVVSAS